MFKPRVYLSLFVLYLILSAAVFAWIIAGDRSGNVPGVAHMVVTMAYSGYVILYRRHRTASGLPDKGLALFQ